MTDVVLSFMSGPRDGELLVVEAVGDSPRLQIGRSAECEVAIPEDPEASRRHAVLTRQGDAWWLEDLGSANGVFIGEFGRAVRVSVPTEIEYGQVFRIGLTRLRLEPPASAEMLAAEAGAGAAPRLG